MSSVQAPMLASNGMEGRYRVEYESYVGFLTLDLTTGGNGRFRLDPTSIPPELVGYFRTRINEELLLNGGVLPDDLSGVIIGGNTE
jgi:hypothetical protein